MSWIKAIASSALTVGLAPVIAQPNLVVNGDFEDPSLAGVFSDYTNTPFGNADEGTWWISPWQPGGPWTSTLRPTGVAHLNVNGDNSALAGVLRVWFQEIAVEPGRAYRFEAWALGTVSGCAGFTLELDVEGVATSSLFCPGTSGVYERIDLEFVATTSAVTVAIRNVSGITFPNDFQIDDIAVVLTRCNVSDIASPSGVLDLADVDAFISAFLQGASLADVALPVGVLDLSDVDAFINAFLAGCP